eukprot:5820833-Pleurochrysis_carterae.AAC.1
MPSGLLVGPEKSRRTVCDDRARALNSAVGCNTSVGESAGPVGCTGGRRDDSPSSGTGGNATVSESTASEIDTDPGARFHARLGEGGARFHGVRTAPERQDGHNPRFLPCECLVRRYRQTRWRTSCTVQDVGCVKHSVRPERGGRVARHEVGTRQLHDGSDGSLRHTVQLMHVRRASGRVHAVGSEEVGEFARNKLPCVVAV